MDNSLYYRIYVTREDLVAVVTMQWFDESDYDESKFFTDEDGERLKFDDEDKALEWVNTHVKPDKIHPDDRRVEFNMDNYLK